jgi:alanyl-tRNA synthetase
MPILPDKQVKKRFKQEASEDPDRYYATKVLKAAGFHRRQCKLCQTWFWDKDKDREICGDTNCVGGFRFFDNNPCKNKFDYIQTWQEFAKLFSKLGYTPIDRYPVTARWRDDTDFVQASIYDFQPYVVSGEVEPPANPLVVPQFCLRFNDIDNVGVTGSHMTGFVMIGQHMFVPPDKWDQDKVFSDIKTWLNQGMGIDDKEITFHEDAWAGGGNFGPCMEFFSRGVEIGNQVYMMFEQTNKGPKELKLKVLDMGMGHERCAWFMQATPTIYDATFPTVMEKLRERVGLRQDEEIIRRFVPYSGLLNIDEIDDIDLAWGTVSKKTGIEKERLKKEILPNVALYSIAEHARALLVALSDGALPGNVGGGYNLRVLLRRSLGFLDRNNWDITLQEIAGWHAEYLKPMFPELSRNLSQVKKILDVEKEKYEATKGKIASILKNLSLENIDEKTLLRLYDSNGISPEMIADIAQKKGISIKVPENFYARVSELHEKSEQDHATRKEEQLPLGKLPETKAMYLEDYEKTEAKGRVQKIIGRNVILDQTIFYPTSGGQIHDIGTIDGQNVQDVFKQGAVIVHVMEKEPGFREGALVSQKIDFPRREQLSKHHTATHIVNAAARKVLGNHVNQAGAKKTEEKSHLDITHYQGLSEEEKEKIEKIANDIVGQALPIKTSIMPRKDAEKRFGQMIYQGGAVPGKNLRIVDIEGTDVEACAGTHLKNTKDVGKIKITKSSKISDGVVRLEYVAGKALKSIGDRHSGILKRASELLGVPEEQVPMRAKELFQKWKKAKKAVRKKKTLDPKDLELTVSEDMKGDLLALTADFLRTQPEYINNTIERFMKELEGLKKGL